MCILPGLRAPARSARNRPASWRWVVGAFAAVFLVIGSGAPAASPAKSLGELGGSWALRWNNLQTAEIELDAEFAGCEIPISGLGVESSTASLVIRGGSLSEPFDLQANGITRPAEKLPLEPWSLSLRAVPTLHQIDLRGRAKDGSETLEIDFDGRVDLESHRSELSAKLASVHFSPEGLQPGHLWPGLAEIFERVVGDVHGHGELAWSEGELTGRLEIGLLELSVETEAARIDGLNGVVVLSPLRPLQTPPGQRLSMARLDLGVELSGGEAWYRIEPGGVLHIEEARWSFAGGTVSTRGRLDLSAPTRQLDLRVTDVPLENLLALVRLDGLDGQGSVSGSLPLSLSEEGVTVRDGRIHAKPGGVLRYRPAEATHELAGQTPGLDVLLPALENLRFETLAVGLDGRLDGPLVLSLAIAGANPDFREGHPLEINVSVDAHLADLLRSGNLLNRIPGQIQREIERLRRKLGDETSEEDVER